MPLEGPLLEAPGGSLFGLSGVLTVGSSRCLHTHAEALRVRGGGQRITVGQFRAGRCWLGGRGTRSGLEELSACPRGRKVGLGAPPQDPLTLCLPNPQEKCINCTRKFRCTQGFKLEVSPGLAQLGPCFACSHCCQAVQAPGAQLCSPRPGELEQCGLLHLLGEARRPGHRSAQRRPHLDLWLRPVTLCQA